ncbi:MULTISPECIES: alpha/beta fold hydrolase [Pontibacter]|uniref:Pimeloyl-ACP methyl ester carboxylesterase n=1 Tax=Pontibacter lucknowensis TaxID=1077936 RepID=A0A1N6UUT3_9BACT|nr:MULTISPECIES: alpha/beta hydrolase [Pontibacter]EJF09618.1 alpha/beta hydrolase [Pontibacter sp. BAB1700]SIQ69291.1 Pimeloyl-ACP methyl ester carboxylesterase [Pontibacter lucknowensis]
MPDLLLLHGALGAASTLQPLQQLLKSDFTVHTLNFQGHGGNTLPDKPFRIEQFAEDVLRYLDQHQLQRVDIFGYSMGGYVALYLALQHPDRVGSIFTLATKFAWSPDTAAKEVKMLQPDKVQEKVPAFAAILAARHQPTDWQEVMRYTADMMLHLGNDPLLTEETLSRIQLPVRVSVGDRDNMVSLQETTWAYQQLPNASLQVFPHTHHPLERVDLNQLQHQIRQFFGKPIV